MTVEALEISGFRNIKDVSLKPGPGANIIRGDNAQGKTNILEAIWLFCGARSFRGARDGEYVAFGNSHARLGLTFFAQGRSQSARISFGEGKKQILINEIKARGRGELAGIFRAVVFSPDHLGLVKDGPGKRRGLLNDSLCQAYPKYGKILDGYERILKQRASVLKDAQTRSQALELLDLWDQSFVEYGSYIIWARARYVSRLAALSREVYAGICDGRESFDVVYRPGCDGLEPDCDRAVLAEEFRRSVRENRDEDICLGMSGIGPHRDDLEISVNGRSARSFGSQGQQRSCVLALKLAECSLLEESGGEPPVVLLDDVMSELDESRRRFLLNRLGGRQVFITCCDDTLFGTLDSGKVFSVDAGHVEMSAAYVR